MARKESVKKQITIPFIIMNLIAIMMNFIVGLSLCFAKWDNGYAFFGLFSLSCWGYLFLYQIRRLQIYLNNFQIERKKK